MKRLVIAPHADDEVLGCASVLDRDTFVLYVGMEEFDEVSRDERLKEVARVAEFFGFQWSWGGPNHIVNRYELGSLIPLFEKTIAEQEPRELFISHQYSYNQDHRTSFQAAIVATRPHDKNHFVPAVFTFEQPDTLWTPGQFEPNVFHAVDVERKLEGLALHASQMRGHRSADLIRSVARVRGEQANLPAAEAFHALRLVRS